MRTEASESPTPTKDATPLVPPMRKIPRCQECGDVDTDVLGGAAICRGCNDAATSRLAHTD
jgi:hypothetical protein